SARTTPLLAFIGAPSRCTRPGIGYTDLEACRAALVETLAVELTPRLRVQGRFGRVPGMPGGRSHAALVLQVGASSPRKGAKSSAKVREKPGLGLPGMRTENSQTTEE